ncbi:MAG: hypothetical protein KGL03_10315, partial [Nitrospirota bacterium]|nr:hypothetical protein [Nitrospirota bacterium]
MVGTLFAHLRSGRSVLLVGAAGMGKTAILRAVSARAGQTRTTRRPLYCRQASTLKVTLHSLAEELLAVDTDAPHSRDQRPMACRFLRKLSLVKLRRLVMPRLRSGRY